MLLFAIINSAGCQFQKIDAELLLSVRPESRMLILHAPTIVEGLLDIWKLNHTYFDHEMSNFSVLARRVSFGYELAEQESKLHSATVSFAAVANMSETEHMIVIDEAGSVEEENTLLSHVDNLYPAPQIFEALSSHRVLSYGSGPYGVQMMRHGPAWLGMVSGAKRFYVAHPYAVVPKNPVCDGPFRNPEDHVFTCELSAGQLLFVPDNWWHASCNIAPHTIAVGGQLYREGEDTLTVPLERGNRGLGARYNTPRAKGEPLMQISVDHNAAAVQ